MEQKKNICIKPQTTAKVPSHIILVVKSSSAFSVSSDIFPVVKQWLILMSLLTWLMILQMIMWMMESMTIRMENVLGKSMRVIMVRIINPIIIIKMKG